MTAHSSSSKLLRTLDQNMDLYGLSLLHILLSEYSVNWLRRRKHLLLRRLRSARLSASNYFKLLFNSSFNVFLIPQTRCLDKAASVRIMWYMVYSNFTCICRLCTASKSTTLNLPAIVVVILSYLLCSFWKEILLLGFSNVFLALWTPQDLDRQHYR